MYMCTLRDMANTRRDPVGRKRTIIQAASELIMEHGPRGVTHRKVAERAGVPLGSTTQYFSTLDELLAAAMSELAQKFDADVEALRVVLRTSTDLPNSLAKMISKYLSDPAQVRRETVFFAAHTQHPHLQHLANTWQERMVAELAAYTSPRAARAVATYVNGLTLEAIYQDVSATQQEIAEAIAKLLELEAGETEAGETTA